MGHYFLDTQHVHTLGFVLNKRILFVQYVQYCPKNEETFINGGFIISNNMYNVTQNLSYELCFYKFPARTVHLYNYSSRTAHPLTKVRCTHLCSGIKLLFFFKWNIRNSLMLPILLQSSFVSRKWRIYWENQWCGSGSGRLCIHLGPWIRIQRYTMKGKAEFNQQFVFFW